MKFYIEILERKTSSVLAKLISENGMDIAINTPNGAEAYEGRIDAVVSFFLEHFLLNDFFEPEDQIWLYEETKDEAVRIMTKS